jgi:hypothetical protein
LLGYEYGPRIEEVDEIRTVCGRGVGSKRHTLDVQFRNIVSLRNSREMRMDVVIPGSGSDRNPNIRNVYPRCGKRENKRPSPSKR